MIKRFALVILLVFAASLLLAGGKKEDTGIWQPTKPLTVIVSWPAGGSTDQMTRVVAGVLEDHLGQKIVVVNQPGASGSMGTKGVLDAPRGGRLRPLAVIADSELQIQGMEAKIPSIKKWIPNIIAAPN